MTFEVKHMCPEKVLAQLVSRDRSIEAQAQTELGLVGRRALDGS